MTVSPCSELLGHASPCQRGNDTELQVGDTDTGPQESEVSAEVNGNVDHQISVGLLNLSVVTHFFSCYAEKA